MCCKRDETRMESSLHALDMSTNAWYDNEPSPNDDSVPARRCARWLGRLNSWTASAVDLVQGGGRQKAGALDIPNDGGNRFYVSAKFAFWKLWADHENRRPGDLGFPQNSYSCPLGKHPKHAALQCGEIPLRIGGGPARPITRRNSVGTTVGTTGAKNNKAPNDGALRCNSGGGTGIRTLGRLSPSPVFKTGAFNRSAIPPRAAIVPEIPVESMGYAG